MIPYEPDNIQVALKVDEAEKIAKEFEFEQVSVKSSDLEIKDNKLHVQGTPFNISRGGVLNLCDALKIPDPFANRIPTDLFVTNVNRLAKENKDTLIDLYFDPKEILIDSNYRAGYQPVPNKTILTQLADYNKEFDFEKVRFMFQNHLLKIEVAGNGLEIKRKGEVHALGSMITHYPTNKSITLGNFTIWTVACTNGCLLPNDFGREKLINKITRNIPNLVSNFINKLIKFSVNKDLLAKAIEDLHTTKFIAEDFVKLTKRIERLTDRDTVVEAMGKSFDYEMFKEAEKMIDEGNGLDPVSCVKYDSYYGITDFGSNKVREALLSRRFQRIGGQILLNQINASEN